jgi:hypothetical protein
MDDWIPETAMSLEQLRSSPTMAHLLDALEARRDIGHYGRLVFAIVARHFVEEEELLTLLTRDPDFDEGEARGLLDQVRSRGYSPPRREKLLEFQSHQEFPICPNSEDPDACNLYRELNFPEDVYEKISTYHEQKATS